MSVNLSATTPAAPGGTTNVTWQSDGEGNISGHVPAAATTEVKVNGTDVTTQSPINFQNGTNITVSNPSAGNIKIDGPSALPPSGAAGGDLSGTYPNPNVAKVNGGAIPLSKTIVGTNGSGQIVDASSATLSNNTSGTAANLSGTPALPNGTTATTQSPGDTSAKLATDNFVAAAVAAAVDAYLPLAGGTMTGTETFGATGVPAVGAGTAFSHAGSSATATASVTINIGDFVLVIGGGTAGATTVSDNGTGLAITQVDIGPNGTMIATGTITGGGSNAHAGKMISFASFAAGSPNNGSWLCIASTTTTLTLLNPAAVSVTGASATAGNTYVRITANANDTLEQLWICPNALVAATTVTVGAPTNPSVAAATFTGVGGIGAYTYNGVTTTPGSTTLTTTKANSMVVSGFLFVSTAGTITASAGTGTLQTNSVSGTNTIRGTAIVTTQATTVGSYTNTITLNRTATTGIGWIIELLPIGTNYVSNTEQFNAAYWNGGAAVTDNWVLQNLIGPTNTYYAGFPFTGLTQGAVGATGGVGFVPGVIPAYNALRLAFNGEGAGIFQVPSMNAMGSIFCQGLNTPVTPTVVSTGTNNSKTWSYRIVAFDPNNASTIASPLGSNAGNGATVLTSAAFNTITWTAVPGAAYYRVYRQATGGTPSQLGQIAQVWAGQALSVIDDGTVTGFTTTVNTTINWTAGLNINGTWLSSVNPAIGPNSGGGLAIVFAPTANAQSIGLYGNANAGVATGANQSPFFTISTGTTSDANDRVTLAATGANFGLSLQHSRTTLTGDPGIALGGNAANNGNYSATSGTCTEVAIGAIGGEQVGTCKFLPASGTATYTALRVTPTINQALVQTSITNCNVTSATSVTLTVSSGTGFVNGQPIVIAGCTGTNNAQLNGSWTLTSGAGTTTIVVTGSGWTTGNHAEATGTLSMQATGAYTVILVNPTETAVGSPANGNALLDLQVGGTSKFTVNSKGHINNCNGDVQGHISSGSGTTVSFTYATPYNVTPTVTVTPTTNAGAFYLSASSTTGFTITYATSGAQTFNYQVFANGL